MTAIAKEDWCEITKVGVVIKGHPSFEEFQRVYDTWQDINRLSAWAIGDLLHYAETRYGETYSQLMDETGLSYGRLANLKYLSGAVPISRRREGLSLSHHQAVAFLADRPAEQERLLDRAVGGRMNREEFREYVRQYKLGLDGQGKPDQGLLGQSAIAPGMTLKGAVVEYFRAIRASDDQKEDEMFEMMYAFVEKEI